MQRSFLVLLMLLTSTWALAQQGTLSGNVKDKKTGEAVIGATVLVTGTIQAAPVEVDGHYTLKLEPGTYSITITNIGYKPQTFPGIAVRADAITTLNATLEENTTTLQGVTVTGQKQTGTEVALIQDLRKSEVVVSGMSNDQIVKSLDRDAAEVVKRIPGVTIQNNTFVVIRGLSERYNTVLLNDALTPSAETDTRSFSFDVLPSSVIDRILVFKSGAPELPGEMGGGVVKVYTKNSAIENSTTFSFSSSYRAGTTFNAFQRANNSPTDWLGFDNSQRTLPSGTPGTVSSDNATPEQLAATGRSLRNDWGMRNVTARPDLRASLGLTRRLTLGSADLTNVTSLSYSNTLEQYTVSRARYNQPSGGTIQQQFGYEDQQSTAGVRLGIVHNWAVRLNPRHKVEFRNLFNQIGADQTVLRTGVNEADGYDRRDYAFHYTSRSIYSGQLQGTHTLGGRENTTVSWTGGYNYVNRNEPDFRRARTQRELGTDDPFRVTIGRELVETSRFYSDLRENTYMLSGQVERRLTGRDTTRASAYKLRAGFYTERKSRDFNARLLGFVRGTENGFDNSILTRPIDQVFAPENFGPEKLQLDEVRNPSRNYTADNTLIAGYVGTTAPISDKVNLSGGVRIEYNDRQVNTATLGDEPVNTREKRTIVMPSFNSTYNFTLRSLLRAAASVTVNRPEFREQALYPYYDFNNTALIIGNPQLKTATIYNADLRYEFYPSPTEMLSGGVFYKYFNDAIEQTQQPASGSLPNIKPANADAAYDYGAEIELRKSLAGLGGADIWNRFSVLLNASVIRSRVDLSSDSSQIARRPLQGQSPYVVNAGLFYQDTDRGLQLNVQYNVVGKRIFLVGNRDIFTIYEMPRNVLDIAVTKSIGQRLEIKGGIQDVFNQAVRQVQDVDFDAKITSADRDFARYRRGQYSTLGLVYRF
ncbi:TonB-dependent receptor [Hymenobacter sp. J193]|uniref:TonB-dependent receptor n=1 Tax=Hymenobacter sp. J193 TaxID=2898429 RepID=UPI0021509E63|nr:TonB-dependent receptor [Hymenobacter sp. J193]MCR5888489.1 TonB-dependent receptor [Hymenobacter sp. J193]